MKLPDRLGRRGKTPFHSAIATSFAVEFAAVEQILLPQIMASGASNLLLIADARMASLALSDGSTLPTALGRDYALYSPPPANDIFHPKIILQIARDSARAFVSSANLTAAGLAGNAEVAIEIECKNEDSPERDIVRSIWRYLDSLVPPDASPARDALRWALDRAAWLDGPARPDLHELDDGSAIAFLHAPADVGIGDRFVTYVGAKVHTLVAISPYWDAALTALEGLSRRLAPDRIILPIDLSAHEFPVTAPFARTPRIVPLGWPAQRFTHAKILIASTAEHDHILFGSANCTSAALGREGIPGTNAEACIYRRLPAGTAREALGLDRWIDGDPIALADLPPPVCAPPIPLKAIEARHPGTFELDHGTLRWRPVRPGADTDEIHLLDRAARPLTTIPAAAFEQVGDTCTAPIDPAFREPLFFARLLSAGLSSNLAHVTHREALRGRRREVASGAVARALAPFTEGADFDLWMHQAFETLIRADFGDDTQPSGISASRPQPRKAKEDAAPTVTLSYEEFTQARAGGARPGARGTNSLAGTYGDSVRDFLNLLSGRGPATTPTEDGDPAFEDPPEEGGDTDPDDVDAGTEPADHPRPRTDLTDARPIDARVYERHVLAYAEGLERGEDPLGSSDVLRLRYWILFLLYKARCPDLPKGLDGSSASLSWPRFIVRILVGFFCGRRPAIIRVMIARDYTAMPADFMECWTTILWTLDAIETTLSGRRKDRQLLGYIPELRKRVLTLLHLSPEELGSDIALDVAQGLDRTLGRRLGLVPHDRPESTRSSHAPA